MRSRHAWAIGIAAAIAISAIVAFTQDVGADYDNLDCHIRRTYCDDAAPAINALIHGRVAEFFDNQPLMGPVSLFVRAPFAAVARLGSDDLKLVYDLGVLACLLGLAVCALGLVAVMRSRGQPIWLQALIGALFMVNPVVFYALEAGHPEDLLCSAACVGAGLAIIGRRNTAAGVLLGAALATKLWALMIAPAVLVGADRRAALRVGIVATAVVVVSYAPMVAGDAGRLRGTLQAANELTTLPGSVTAVNVWWFVAARKAPFDRNVAVRNGVVITEPSVGYRLSDDVARITHPLAVAIAALLALLWGRGPRARAPDTLLLLFALIFLLRCILEPGNHAYYHLPAVASLLAYEGIASRRPPWASLWLILCVWGTTKLSPYIRTDSGFGLLYLGWALPTAAGLSVWLFGPPRRRARALA